MEKINLEKCLEEFRFLRIPLQITFVATLVFLLGDIPRVFELVLFKEGQYVIWNLPLKIDLGRGLLIVWNIPLIFIFSASVAWAINSFKTSPEYNGKFETPMEYCGESFNSLFEREIFNRSEAFSFSYLLAVTISLVLFVFFSIAIPIIICLILAGLFLFISIIIGFPREGLIMAGGIILGAFFTCLFACYIGLWALSIIIIMALFYNLILYVRR